MKRPLSDRLLVFAASFFLLVLRPIYLRITYYSDDLCCSAGVPTGVFGAEDSAATEKAVTIFCNPQVAYLDQALN